MKRCVFLSLVLLSYICHGASFTLHEGLTTSKKWLGDVANVAECVTGNELFLTEVGNFPKYTHTTLTPKQVEKSLRNSRYQVGKSVTLTTYKPLNRFTKAIAYRDVGSTVVHFNLWRNPRPLSEMLNTAIHEWSHVLGFGHGDNSSIGKQDSVPYRVGSIAAKYIKECTK